MLGRVAVTVVLLESNGIADPSTEDWTPSHRQEVVEKIEEGLDWWKQSLGKLTDKHTLDFVIDRKFVDAAFSTDYEPISRTSDEFSLWVNEFLVAQGFGSMPQLDENMKAFNHSQRLKLKTDWSFTIFVVNSQRDADGQFAPGGSFQNAFSFAGGLFQVIPSTRPASTIAHETGHMFWALDEYAGGASYYRRRGYYNTQNTNALVANPDPEFTQKDSIMAEGAALEKAFLNQTSPDSTFALVGWQDSDRDGFFDVLDRPIELDLNGRYDAFSGIYRWVGSVRVGTLPNMNPSGNQSSISIDRIAKLEMRLEGGQWTTLAAPNSPVVAVDISIPVLTSDQGKLIEFRALSDQGLTSHIFSAAISPAPSRSIINGLYGFTWNDLDRDGRWGSLEGGLSGQSVSINSLPGTPSLGQTIVRASQLGLGPIPSIIDGMNLSSVGFDADGRIGVQLDALTGVAVFHPFQITSPTAPTQFKGKNSMLKVGFLNGTRRVEVSARASTSGAIARMDAFRSDGVVLARSESESLDPSTDKSIVIESETSIAYVIVYGAGDNAIAISHIAAGFPTVTTTDLQGGYQFKNLPKGNYQITSASNATGIDVLGDSSGTLTINDAALSGRLDFPFFLSISPWTNPRTPYDVNQDGLTNGIDVVIVINTINRHGGGILVGSGIPPNPYVDVNNDGILNPLDALAAINHLNQIVATGIRAEGESGLEIGFDFLDNDPIKRQQHALNSRKK